MPARLAFKVLHLSDVRLQVLEFRLHWQIIIVVLGTLTSIYAIQTLLPTDRKRIANESQP